MLVQIIRWFQIRLCVYTPKWSRSAQNHTLFFNGTDICRKQISESCLWKWRWNLQNQAVVKEIACAVTYRGTETMAVLSATIKHLTWTSKQIHCNKSRFLRVLTLIVCFWKSYTAGKLWMEEVILCQVTRVVWPGYSAVLMCIPWHTPSCCLHGVLSLLLLHQVGCMLKVLLKGSC